MTCVRECPSERDKDAKNPSTQWGIARSETAPSPRQQASSLLLPSHHENHLEVADSFHSFQSFKGTIPSSLWRPKELSSLNFGLTHVQEVRQAANSSAPIVTFCKRLQLKLCVDVAGNDEVVASEVPSLEDIPSILAGELWLQASRSAAQKAIACHVVADLLEKKLRSCCAGALSAHEVDPQRRRTAYQWTNVFELKASISASGQTVCSGPAQSDGRHQAVSLALAPASQHLPGAHKLLVEGPKCPAAMWLLGPSALTEARQQEAAAQRAQRSAKAWWALSWHVSSKRGRARAGPARRNYAD
eukprot:CAMPEP_0197680564 /NCGR_PEP_ID=MMETSP1338-20131121/93534_1 /TAXON_ID=43686 ORGANISM="Pelagodinium beii, Strain RCC1491" /NCGR_SAMPLE_ID=MMETSP1338 /ASSEMBLY_ACC=CAM_ASM_000754 /LENGTH=301 /DNA_ID=CAMNT_0043261769 /DNA_START=226 /DNA_END=1129 /DNA_ORIENTATION=+